MLLKENGLSVNFLWPVRTYRGLHVSVDKTQFLLCIRFTLLAATAGLSACGGGGSGDVGGAGPGVTMPADPGTVSAGSGAVAPPVSNTAPSGCAPIGTANARSNALNVTAATYLGLGAGDVAHGVDIAPDCTVLLAGRFSQTDFSVNPVALAAGATTGALVRLNPSGQTVQAVSRLGSEITDLAVRPGQGDIALASNVGLMVVAADLRTVRWQVSGAAQRVAMAADGSVAALFGKTLRVYNATGQEQFSRNFGDSAVNDVAIDSASNRVMVTGFAQRDGGGCSQLQVAWIRSYQFNNTAAWAAWDWTHAQAVAGSNCADTRGMRVAMGRDGKLYFAGESAGGNAIYRWQPTNLALAAPNVKTDSYNDALNTASNHISYFARLDPSTGALEKGQMLLARLSNGRGNTIRPRAIAADELGNVYVGGVSASAIAQRPALSINGRTLADYSGGDPWVLAVSSDFMQRRLWITPADGGRGETLGLAASGGIAAMAARVEALPFVLAAPVQASTAGTASGNTAGFAMVWPGYRVLSP